MSNLNADLLDGKHAWEFGKTHNHFGQTWSGSGGVGLKVINSTGNALYGECTGYGHAGYFKGDVHVTGELVADGFTHIHGQLECEDGVQAKTGTFFGNLTVKGNLYVEGKKNFVEPHPNDPTRAIVYAALEGPEAGTYVRGTAEIKGGEARIELPEHFALVTAEQGLTVTLTPLGKPLQLYVAEKAPSRIVVREASGKSGQFDIWSRACARATRITRPCARTRSWGTQPAEPRLAARTDEENR